jgi:hypothetical protein
LIWGAFGLPDLLAGQDVQLETDFGLYPTYMTGRNVFRGPGAWKFDLGPAKSFQLTERFNLQFRAESFDLFNHINMYVNGFVADAALFPGQPLGEHSSVFAGVGDEDARLLRRWHEATGYYRSRSWRCQLTVYDVGLRLMRKCPARPLGSHAKCFNFLPCAGLPKFKASKALRITIQPLFALNF